MNTPNQVTKIGVVGTGYVSRHAGPVIERRDSLTVTRVLTRRNPRDCTNHPLQDRLTRSIDDLLEHCDVVFECTGDPVYAADTVSAAFDASRPVVTMNAEFHVTAGSYFADKGLLTEAEGDQPGSLAALHDDIVEMGFSPLVYGNLKGFLNHNPTPDEMAYWADKKNVRLDKVTSFTDGTKLQVEQALVANQFDATIISRGMVGPEIDDIEAGGKQLARQAAQLGRPVADYLLFSDAPHGVFIAAEHPHADEGFLEHVKMGTGPYYILSRGSVLIHLEIPRTLRQISTTGERLLDNSTDPRVNVAAVAKRSLPSGTRIERGIGSFDVRGECVRIDRRPDAVPIGLIQDAVVRQALEPGQTILFEDIDLPDTLALHAWRKTLDRVLTETDDESRELAEITP